MTERKRRLGPTWLILLALALAGCAGPPFSPGLAAGRADPPPSLPRLGMAATGPVRLGPDLVELLTDGAAAAARLVDAVRSARQSVHAEIYEFDRPDLLAAMLDARRRGVEVQTILDPTVAVDGGTRASLSAAGAEVSLFPDQQLQIDHVKLLLVDGATAFFGGMNWGARSWRNHDFEVALQGPSAQTLEAIFAADRVRCGRASPAAGLPALRDPSGPLRILTTYPDDQIRPAVLGAIGSARRSVFITLYVMTDAHVVAALADAVRRGVGVWCLLDPGQDPNRDTVVRLRLAGVAVAYYHSHGELLHAKAMVVDGERLIVGSANWSRSGFTRNHELDAELSSPSLAQTALAAMEADWRASL